MTGDAARSAAAPPKPGHARAWWAVSVAVLILGVAFVLVAYSEADTDLWGHVRFGRDLWQTRNLWRTDVYSYLSGDQPWINHEWLAEVVLYLAYAAVGPAGLIALKVLVAFVIVGLTYAYLVRRGVGPGLAGALTLFSLLLLLPGLWTLRPQHFTYLCWLLLLLALAAAAEGQARWLWALPPLFALWANLHGGFLAGIALLAAWSLVTLASSRRLPGKATVVLCLLVSVLATLLNPYGSHLWAFLLRTATAPRPEIREWQPVEITSILGVAYLALLAVAWLGVGLSRRPRRWPMLALLYLVSLLPLLAVRHCMLFAVAVPILAWEHVADAAGRLRGALGARPQTSRGGSHAAGTPDARPTRGRVPGPWLAVLCCASSLGVVALWWPSVDHISMPRGPAGYPVRAVALLRESGAGGNLAVDFKWGEYVLWHLGPRVKVSVDGRRETVYTNHVYQGNLHLMYGVDDWDAVLDDYDTDMALVSKGRPAYNLMLLKPGWTLVYEDPLCALFALEHSALAAQLLATPPQALPYDGDGLAFP